MVRHQHLNVLVATSRLPDLEVARVGGRALCRCRRAVVVAAKVGPGTGRSPLLLLFLREQRPEHRQ